MGIEFGCVNGYRGIVGGAYCSEARRRGLMRTESYNGTEQRRSGRTDVVGIRELARECGVSVATVSRALNGHPEVSDVTRRTVQEAAARLGYRPSQSARALVRGRSDTVGLLWDTGYEATGRRHPFLLALLIGVKRALNASGRHVLLLNVDDHNAADRERAYLDAALQHQLDGVVMMGVDVLEPAVHGLYSSGFPCVALDLPIEGPRASYVTSDNYAGAVEAVRYLHGLGHRKVATITGPLDLLPAKKRMDGFRDAVRELGMVERPDYVLSGDFFLDSGYACGKRLAEMADRPTAVFAAGDEMAIGAVHAFADAGIGIPGDMAVVGFDDIETASLVRPALTTVAQDPLAIGAAAVELLLTLIDSDPKSAEHDAVHQGSTATAALTTTRTPVAQPRTVPTRLVIRGSCAGPEPK
jgi:LacI family transcriptional regulator, galactose operon repressor